MSDEEYDQEVEEVKEGDPPTQQISVKCRAKRLFQLLPKLNEAQRTSVRRIGIVGMLELRFPKFPLEHVLLFLETFNDGTYVFRTYESKEFMVSKHDVHDCFLLPFGPKELNLVPTGQMKRSNSPENKSLKDRWRERFGVKSSNGSIPLGIIKKVIEADIEGGDYFCRLFVLFCMSSFLAPTSNDGVDFKLLRAVGDVSDISQSDWCSYVLKALVTAGLDVKKRHTRLLGCIPFLMITYFQRFDYRGDTCAHDLPLIKHWDEARLKNRIKGEVGDGGLGRQTWSTVRYPRCIHAPTTTPVTLIADRQFLIGFSSRPQSDKKFIQIELPEGVEDDDELKARAVDDVHENYLKIQRNSVAFHAWYFHAISMIKHLTTGKTCPTALLPSQSTQEFWESEELHRFCDEVEDISARM
ncbi:uncharacterized protein LOC141630849 [Silene latifolia]|uniref:uncharacterized protein LOC141630849 n=1 Tax=Silene latifolia TaxID=37657 RepID=UPI003D77693A